MSYCINIHREHNLSSNTLPYWAQHWSHHHSWCLTRQFDMHIKSSFLPLAKHSTTSLVALCRIWVDLKRYIQGYVISYRASCPYKQYNYCMLKPPLYTKRSHLLGLKYSAWNWATQLSKHKKEIMWANMVRKLSKTIKLQPKTVYTRTQTLKISSQFNFSEPRWNYHWFLQKQSQIGHDLLATRQAVKMSRAVTWWP